MSAGRLCRVMEATAARGPYDLNTWIRFVARAEMVLPSMSLSHLARIASSCLRVRWRPAAFFAVCFKRNKDLEALVQRAEARDVCAVLQALAGLECLDTRIFSLLADRLAEPDVINNCRFFQLALAVNALAAGRVLNPRLLSAAGCRLATACDSSEANPQSTCKTAVAWPLALQHEAPLPLLPPLVLQLFFSFGASGFALFLNALARFHEEEMALRRRNLQEPASLSDLDTIRASLTLGWAIQDQEHPLQEQQQEQPEHQQHCDSTEAKPMEHEEKCPQPRESHGRQPPTLLLQQVDARGCCLALAALSRLQHRDGFAVLVAAAATATASQVPVHLAKLTAQQTATLLNSISKLLQVSPSLSSELLNHLRPRVKHLDPIGCVSALNAIRHLRLSGDDPLTEQLETQAASQVHQCDWHSLHALASIARCGKFPRLLQLLLQEQQKQRHQQQGKPSPALERFRKSSS
ncbi:uncharacterized protein LOC34622119 [Cyclospora cayetanensis]|uniref:Uncharacterized protein LOC34622119 n=1 Tax=Cyclospora cayetanensis TaxID=88456 RepID=A0A6P6S1P3_9EIME|nr:uncharacterized protein LOC34622119 [Cyclospora cayetanensis]